MKKRWEVEIVPPGVPKICKHKISQLQKIKQLKRNMVCKYKLYWCIMSTISILILLPKNTLWFYLLWTWLKQGLFLTLVGKWIERSSQQISSFELIRDLLFFKSLNVKALGLKFFGVLEAWSIELQKFGFDEVYGGFFNLISIELQRTRTIDLLDFSWKMDWKIFSMNL